MKLKWIQTCSEHGVYSEDTLYQWLDGRWEPIDSDVCKDWELEEFLKHEDGWFTFERQEKPK
jgi:hypothetical protein